MGTVNSKRREIIYSRRPKSGCRLANGRYDTVRGDYRYGVNNETRDMIFIFSNFMILWLEYIF